MAANTTFAQWVTQYTADVKYIETVRQVVSTVTDNILAQEDAIITALDGNTGPISNELQALVTLRSNFNLTIGTNAKTFLDSRILGVRSIINKNGATIEETIAGLYEYMDTNGEAFLSRIFVRGTWTAAGSNTGNGEVLRCTVDAKGYDLENSHAETITAKVIATPGGSSVEGVGKTQPGSEKYRFEGTVAGDDNLDKELSGRGSGLTEDLVNRRSGNSIVSNPSFSDYVGTGASITAINGWTVTNAIGNFEQDTTNYFVEDESENGTPASLKITATDTIEQKMSISGNSFRANTPYLCQIKFNRTVGSASGTLVLHMGTKSVSVAVSAQSGWTTLRLDIGANSWFENFDNGENTSIKVVWTRTSGDILIDDLRVIPFDEFDNIPTICLGNETRELIGDSGTITDSETGAVHSRWWWRLYEESMPNRAPATQVTASGGRTLTFANSGSADTITASTGDFTTEGYYAGMLVTIAGTSSNNMTTGPIASVTATVITFESTTSLTNEGPLSATATLDATASISDPTVTF